MFWKLKVLSASSPVEFVLVKENFSLEELLDEEEIIQECKSLNNRLINFLRDRTQVEQLLRYIIEEPPEDADSKRTFKFPFVACEIFTCEIDVILKTLVEEDELMNLLFSFLEPNCPHSALLSGYFSKTGLLLSNHIYVFLHRIKAMETRVLTLAEREVNPNHPIFFHRFVEAPDHYAVFFDLLEATPPPNSRDWCCRRSPSPFSWMKRSLQSITIAIATTFYGLFSIILGFQKKTTLTLPGVSSHSLMRIRKQIRCLLM